MFISTNKYSDNCYNTGTVNSNSTTDVAINDEIYIGEWCVFKVETCLLVGMMLSFCYTAGKTLKSRQYTKTSASITDKVSIGVLGMWYSWDSNGKLTLKSSTHSFIGIDNYKATIPNPSYFKNIVTVENSILKKLEELTI